MDSNGHGGVSATSAPMTGAPVDMRPGGGDLAVEVAMYRMMVDNIADMIVRGDANLNRSYISPAARELLGHDPADLLGETGYNLVHPDDVMRVHAGITTLGAANPKLSLEFRMRRKDGSYVWVETRYRHVPEDNGVLAVVRDISARKHAEDRLAEANEQLADANLALQAMADRDGLTGLANRRCFDAKLTEEFGRAGRQCLPLGLVLLDVDHFKEFNDRYGHLAGDDCLRRVARAIESCLHRSGDVAARFGGEEFAIVLPATDETGASLMAEHLREAVVALVIEHLGSDRRVLTISAGAASMIPTCDDEGPNTLIAAADRALYKAKQAGRNKVCVATA